MKTRKKNALFGRYPCCDMVNNAIRDILNGRTDAAIDELLQAIWKADGYLHEDLEHRVKGWLETKSADRVEYEMDSFGIAGRRKT